MHTMALHAHTHMHKCTHVHACNTHTHTIRLFLSPISDLKKEATELKPFREERRKGEESKREKKGRKGSRELWREGRMGGANQQEAETGFGNDREDKDK